MTTYSLLSDEAYDVPRSEIKLGLAIHSRVERFVAVTDISLMINVSGPWASFISIDLRVSPI